MLINDDCLEHLKTMPSDSLDSLVTDPPAGISFMGKSWDSDKGGRDAWIEWMAEVARECLRVLKPGAHGLVWALPRTSHWTAFALEKAGFEVRDIITHIFSTGFPKNHDISKAIDKMAGAERDVVGKYQYPSDSDRPPINQGGMAYGSTGQTYSSEKFGAGFDRSITAPATPEAKQWQGWGTSLKPASERWVLVRKPLKAVPWNDIMLLHISFGELLWSLLPAKFAEKILELNHVESKEELPFAQWHVAVVSTAELLGLLEVTAMFKSQEMAETFLNIVLSWNSILVESSSNASKSTTETETDLTTELKTLSCWISEITQESTIQGGTSQNGLLSNASLAEGILSESAKRLRSILTLFAERNATEGANSPCKQPRLWQPADTGNQTAHSSEDYILIRKPLGEKTVAKNVLKHRTGGLNIDASRIGTEQVESGRANRTECESNAFGKKLMSTDKAFAVGRFPANLIVDETAVEELDRQSLAGGMHSAGSSRSGGKSKQRGEGGLLGVGNHEGNGMRFGDTGGASRFFFVCKDEPSHVTENITTLVRSDPSLRLPQARFVYSPKASKKDRNEGLEGMPVKQATGGGGGVGDYLNDVNSASGKFGSEKAPSQNFHPTVKSTKLMQYLITLVTPPGGTVLDPFMGSGSTGVAAIRGGFGFYGIEKESEYYEIAKRRIEAARSK